MYMFSFSFWITIQYTTTPTEDEDEEEDEEEEEEEEEKEDGEAIATSTTTTTTTTCQHPLMQKLVDMLWQEYNHASFDKAWAPEDRTGNWCDSYEKSWESYKDEFSTLIERDPSSGGWRVRREKAMY